MKDYSNNKFKNLESKWKKTWENMKWLKQKVTPEMKTKIIGSQGRINSTENVSKVNKWMKTAWKKEKNRR